MSIEEAEVFYPRLYMKGGFGWFDISETMKESRFLSALILLALLAARVSALAAAAGGRQRACARLCGTVDLPTPGPARSKRSVILDPRSEENPDFSPWKAPEDLGLEEFLDALMSDWSYGSEPTGAATRDDIQSRGTQHSTTASSLHRDSPGRGGGPSGARGNATEEPPHRRAAAAAAAAAAKRSVTDPPPSRFQRFVVCRPVQNQSLHVGECLSSTLYNSSLASLSLGIECRAPASPGLTQVHFDSALLLAKASLLFVRGCSVKFSENFSSTEDTFALKGFRVHDSTVEGFEHFLHNATFPEMVNIHIVNSSIPGADLPSLVRFLGQALNVTWRNNTLLHSELECGGTSQQVVSSKTLEFSRSNLTFVPPCFLGENLTDLSLANNRISDLSSLQHPTKVPSQHLQHLLLDHNEIADLGVIAYFDYLCELSVSHNRLTRITRSSVAHLLWITRLDLSHNRIAHVARGAFRLNKILECLDLAHNRVATIDSSHTAISKMNFVLDFNLLSRPPFAAANFSSALVGRVWAAHNPFHCDCSLEAFQRVLQRSREIADSVPERQCSNVRPCYLNKDPAQMFFVQAAQYTCTKSGSGERLAILDMDLRESCPVFDGCPDPCDCRLLRAGGTTVVDCAHSNLTHLPSTMPAGRVDLRLQGNRLGEVREAGYLSRVVSLDLSGAGATRLSPVLCDFLGPQLALLNLSDNGLRELPECMRRLDLAGRSLDLSGNPWSCGCSSAWMAGWIAAHPDVFQEAENTRCSDEPFAGTPVRDVDASRLSCGPLSFLGLVVALVVVGALVAATAGLLYKFRGVWPALVYARFGVRVLQWGRAGEEEEEQGEEGKQFDAFVSYSSRDERWILQELAPRLEGETTRGRLRLCLHFRHFVVGEAIADNILSAVDHSRSTLLVLSPAFLASEWCLFEFQQAHYQLLTEGATSLVVVVLDDLDPAMLTPELAAYLKHHACLDVRERWFWEKLRYALPRPRRQRGRRAEGVADGEQEAMAAGQEALALQGVPVQNELRA